MEERLYTVEEVAERLAVGIDSVKLWINTGNLKGVKIDDEWYVRHRDLEDFITSHNRTAGSDTRGEYRPGL